MYKVLDHQTGAWLKFGSIDALMRWWKGKFTDIKGFVSFSELNVTGKDLKLTAVHTGGYIQVFGCILPEYRKTLVPRRFQVFDCDGRSVDVRLYTHMELSAVKPCHSVPSWMPGAKTHYHRVSGPAMHHRSLQQAFDDSYTDELHAIGLVPMRGDGAMRRKVASSRRTLSRFSRGAGNFHDLSWKNQSKAVRQWARHKKGSCSLRHSSMPGQETGGIGLYG